jgi:hypothetical protein
MSRPPSTTPSIYRTGGRAGAWGAIGLVAGAVLLAGSAHAQSASGTLSAYRTGYGAGLSGLISPVSPSLISSSGSYSIADGTNQTGAVVATQPSNSSTSGGAGQSSTGVGQGGVSHDRAPLAVVDSSNANTSSAHGATAGAADDLVLNGKLNLDGGQ